MHHQRHRRTRWQLRARGDRDGPEDAQRLLQAANGHQHAIALSDQPKADVGDRKAGEAKQSDRRPEAFAHEAGIHQDGMLKERSTYEIMKPEDVGIPRTELVLGKHSGRHALKQRIADLGYHLTDEQLNRLFEEFKRLADRKKEIYDADVEALAENQLQAATGNTWTLSGFTSTAGTGSQTSAAVTLKHKDGTVRRDAAVGNGPIDALFKTINRITGVEVKVVDYRVRAVTQEIDALREVNVEVEHGG